MAERIGKDIERRGKARLSRINGKTDAKEMWAAVRQLTGRQQEAGVVAGITAESLNEHYAAISTHANYTPPLLKHSKFADDTYLVIPASNVDSRVTEIDNIETWARTNNLTLNRNKSKEIVFSDPIDEGFRLNHHRQRRILPVSRLSKFSASQ